MRNIIVGKNFKKCFIYVVLRSERCWYSGFQKGQGMIHAFKVADRQCKKHELCWLHRWFVGVVCLPRLCGGLFHVKHVETLSILGTKKEKWNVSYTES